MKPAPPSLRPQAHLATALAVIQSSGDGYLPSGRAQTLFGADSARRRFFDVTASNHRFSGGATAFRLALNNALNWISTDEGNLQ